VKPTLLLLEIHDTDNDHDVGGQDLPFIVSVKFTGNLFEAQGLIEQDADLGAFNIQPARRKPGQNHIEFLTFAFEAQINKFFSINTKRLKLLSN
jgi:hypothetical protein